MIRTRICFYILLLAPLLVYYQTIFHEYGFRDDYSHLREAQEEPGTLVKFTASHGRPLYGALLETSFGEAADVTNLPWLRLGSVLLLTLLGLALWRQLHQSGWTEIQAAAIGLGVTLLPAAQVTASWAACWPQVLALLLSLAGFTAIEAELERGGMKRAVALLGGCMIYLLAGLIYQSNALFAVVPIAAILLVRAGREPLTDLRWAAVHLVTLIIGVAGSYLLVQWLFSSGIFQESARMQLEGNPLTKLGWFLWQPLPNALGLYALRDGLAGGAIVFWGAVIVTTGLIGYGVKSATDPLLRKKWLLCLVALPVLAHVVSLFAAERSVGYRTLFPLSGLMLVLLVFALRSVVVIRKVRWWKHYTLIGLIAAAVALVANRQAFSLLAVPQGSEWEMVLSPVMRTTFNADTKVHIITPAPVDRSTGPSLGSEFGSRSSTTEQVVQEMFRSALRERFGSRLPKSISYTLTVGPEAPAAEAYDLVIDLRNPAERPGR